MFPKKFFIKRTTALCVCVCCSPFPEVAESVQEELDTYRAQEDEVKRLKSIMVRERVWTAEVTERSRPASSDPQPSDLVVRSGLDHSVQGVLVPGLIKSLRFDFPPSQQKKFNVGLRFLLISASCPSSGGRWLGSVTRDQSDVFWMLSAEIHRPLGGQEERRVSF